MKRPTLFAKVIALAWLTGWVAIFAWPIACSPPSNAQFTITAPDARLFPPVADLMGYRCGSLDCHGNAQRNLIVYSCYGLRLDQDAAPGCRDVGGTNTTPAEYTATYDSLVALEPGVMTEVVQSRGVDLDQLTFVRKARGEEAHTGGKLWSAGSPDDQCVAQWLADQSSTTATCQAALGRDIDAGTL